MNLSLMTLNLWGIGYGYAKDRPERMAAFAQLLPSLGADIIALQEVWLEEDQSRLSKAATLPYSYYFKSGILGGSGLLTLSRFPIVEVAFHEFRLKTRPERLDHGDYYFGKGIGLTRLECPFGLVDVYNLHPLAQYDFDENDMYLAQRAASHFEATQFIQQHSPSNPLIVLGDFNMQPHHLGYRLMRDVLGLTDCYAALHPQDAGITFSLDNFYNLNYRESERLDYIWTRGFTPLSAEVSLTSIPEHPPISYSDHYAVVAEVALDSSLISNPAPPHNQLGILRELSSYLLAAQIGTEERRQSHQRLMYTSLLLGFLLHLSRSESKRTLTRLLDYVLSLLSITYAAYSWLQWMVLLRREVRMFQALNDEVRLEIQVLESQAP